MVRRVICTSSEDVVANCSGRRRCRHCSLAIDGNVGRCALPSAPSRVRMVLDDPTGTSWRRRWDHQDRINLQLEQPSPLKQRHVDACRQDGDQEERHRRMDIERNHEDPGVELECPPCRDHSRDRLARHVRGVRAAGSMLGSGKEPPSKYEAIRCALSLRGVQATGVGETSTTFQFCFRVWRGSGSRAS